MSSIRPSPCATVPCDPHPCDFITKKTRLPAPPRPLPFASPPPPPPPSAPDEPRKAAAIAAAERPNATAAVECRRRCRASPESRSQALGLSVSRCPSPSRRRPAYRIGASATVPPPPPPFLSCRLGVSLLLIDTTDPVACAQRPLSPGTPSLCLCVVLLERIEDRTYKEVKSDNTSNTKRKGEEKLSCCIEHKEIICLAQTNFLYANK